MSNVNQPALDKLMKARTGLLIDQPFFGTLAMRLKMIEKNDIPTLAVDNVNVFYNAGFVNSLTNQLVKSALAHEVFHCVLNHCGKEARGKGLDPQKFNYAADYVVNDMLKQAGMELGEGWLYDPQYAGMTAEQIYKMLPSPPPGQSQKPSAGAPGPLDQVMPGSPDPAMQAQQAADWKVAAVQAATAAKAVGKLHSTLEQFVDKILDNKVDWTEVLRRFIVTAAKNDYSYRRMNKKMQAAGYYLPGLFSEEAGPIVIAVDESGSVDPKIVAAFGAEIATIRQDLRPELVTVMHFDSRVGKVEEFGPDDEFELKRFCNGGTDFRPAMKKAERMPKQPLCMIYLTDLYGPFPDAEPGFPVLWVTINKEEAPFGETIQIEI